MSRARPSIVLAHWPGLGLFDDRAIERFNEMGTVLDAEPLGQWDDPRSEELLGEAEVIVGHWGCPLVDGPMLDRAPKLGLFAYAAGTVKLTVTDAVWDRPIRVTSGANANAEPVAEFTLAAILFANKGVLWRRIGAESVEASVDELMGRGWGNYDRTIGIVAASLIGRRVIQLLRAFPHLDVALYDPFVTPDEARELGVTKLELTELCAASDILSIHAPALATTHHMIGAEQLAALRDGATVINTARGWVLDHEALVPHLTSGRLRAVLDVTDPEPLPDDSVLRSLPNVYLTPHLAGTQGSELGRMAEYAAEEVRRWSAGEPGLNEVHKEQLDRLA
ncbi:MAG: hydroxyacid dehydrogenase [Acidimicrobiales bacterium]